MPKRKPISSLRKPGLVALLKSMKPSAEEFPDIQDRVPAQRQLETSLRSKRPSGYRVGTITEDDKYGGR